MKATGEVMAIGRSLEESLLKAIRSLEAGYDHLYDENLEEKDSAELLEKIAKADDERLFAIGALLRKQVSVDEIHEVTKIDRFFLQKLARIVALEDQLIDARTDETVLRKLKQSGFSDTYISKVWETEEQSVYELRQAAGIKPVFKMVDTCAAEFASPTPYFYSSYEQENESVRTDKESILVLGSGPIRIGQGIEFDYATVHTVWAIKEAGYEAIIMNNNPETVSTDFSTSDKLYFEPLTIEDVMNVIQLEQPKGLLSSLVGKRRLT